MALKELRRASTGRIASIFIGLIIISFAIWGIQGAFTVSQGRGVAQVGDVWISGAQFQERLQQEMQRRSAQAGREMTLEEARNSGLTRQVLDMLIDLTAIEIAAAKMGLAAHDETLKRVIRSTPAFQDASGTFNEDIYRAALLRVGYEPVRYETEIRKEVVRTQSLTSVMGGSVLPRGLLGELLAYRGETREIAYITVPQSVVGDIAVPDDDTLKAYVAANSDRYTRPQRRSFVVLLIKPDAFERDVEVTDGEIAEIYESGKERFAEPEVRETRVLSFPSREEAEAALAALKNGSMTFEQLGAERGFSADETAFRALTEAALAEERGDPSAAAGVFAAAEPGFVGPIDGTLAFAIAETRAITPSRQKPIEEVREEIKTTIAMRRAEDLAYQTAKAVEDGRDGGESLEQIAVRLGLPLLKYEGVDAKGGGTGVRAEVSSSEVGQIVAAAFRSDVGQENNVEPLTDGGQYVVRVDDIAEAALKSLDEVRAEAGAAYAAQERRRRLETLAEEMIVKAAAGGIGAAARLAGSEPQSLDTPISRQHTDGVLSPQIIERLFAAPLGALVSGRSANGEDVLIAAALNIDAPSAEETNAAVAALARSLDETVANNLLTQYIAALREKFGVKINETLYEQAASGARL